MQNRKWTLETHTQTDPIKSLENLSKLVRVRSSRRCCSVTLFSWLLVGACFLKLPGWSCVLSSCAAAVFAAGAAGPSTCCSRSEERNRGERDGEEKAAPRLLAVTSSPDHREREGGWQHGERGETVGEEGDRRDKK